MAITKLMHMKDCGNAHHGMHLKRSIKYIFNETKTQNGRLIGATNCQPDYAYEQMKATKERYGKNSKRQGYHFVLSFEKGEVSPDLAYEITGKFVEEFLGKKYEAVFAVHDNTEHIHSHIVFNSVSFVDGRKFHYKQGDWEKIIQPITNRICMEYGLSYIDLDNERTTVKDRKNNREWYVQKDGEFVWSEMIKRDIDACILQSSSFDEFISMLNEKGYEVKTGKYIAVKPPGMNRFRRCKTLGDNYDEANIKRGIAEENIETFLKRKEQEYIKPTIRKCYVKRYRRCKLTGLQKKYYRRLYRIGQLKKRPYSQAWKYKDEIKKLHKWQQEYVFLEKHDIRTKEELDKAIKVISEKQREAKSQKQKLYREKANFKKIFDIVNELNGLRMEEETYQNGDKYFEKEHNRWQELSDILLAMGYSYEEAVKLKEYYNEKYREESELEKSIRNDLKIASRISNSMLITGTIGEGVSVDDEDNEKKGKRPLR